MEQNSGMIKADPNAVIDQLAMRLMKTEKENAILTAALNAVQQNQTDKVSPDDSKQP